ncbi:MAG: agmatine deiminase [Clostridiales bacterium]|nr:agmatine deiminase [Clostridiales bacterium]
MEHVKTIPAEDGFSMPGEYERHWGTVMIWPERLSTWGYGAKRARAAFARIANAIADSENVIMLAGSGGYDSAREALSLRIPVIEIASDDSWARDVGPTFVRNAAGEVRGIDWRFNAWGRPVDGLYADWSQDEQLAAKLCEALGYEIYDAGDFVLEGGSIHSDGEGTALVTEECLLSAGRNPQMTKAQIEDRLRAYLGVDKVIWLPYGMFQDETNGHVDNICAFVAPGEVVLAWSEDESDPQYMRSAADLKVLEEETDAKGRRITIHKLPLPKKPVCLTQEDVDGLVFGPGDYTRKVGDRQAASYVNFYLCNGGVIIPQFGDENDARAVEILEGLFPERRVYPIQTRNVIVGGGNIHCITQQIPAGKSQLR